jgi:hypothetical protein
MPGFTRRPLASAAVLAVSLVTLLSCSETTAVDSGSAPDEAISLFGSAPRLVECPTSETQSTTAQIGVDGGLLQLGGTVVTIPVGALLGDTEFTLTVPASRYVEVQIEAEGHEGQRFDFELPVVVNVDYSRCSRSNILRAPLTAWYIDDDTKQLLEEMVSIDDKLLQRVTFTTGHLSTYAIAE